VGPFEAQSSILCQCGETLSDQSSVSLYVLTAGSLTRQINQVISVFGISQLQWADSVLVIFTTLLWNVFFVCLL